MISEALLDQVIDDLTEEEIDMVAFYTNMARTMPVLTSYLTDQDTELLTDREHDYLLYLAMVLLRAGSAVGAAEEDADPAELETREEAAWEALNACGARPLDRLRERTPFEAVVPNFILDALEVDEDLEFVTEPGGQLLYVKLITMAGVLLPD